MFIIPQHFKNQLIVLIKSLKQVELSSHLHEFAFERTKYQQVDDLVPLDENGYRTDWFNERLSTSQSAKVTNA